MFLCNPDLLNCEDGSHEVPGRVEAQRHQRVPVGVAVGLRPQTLVEYSAGVEGKSDVDMNKNI